MSSFLSHQLITWGGSPTSLAEYDVLLVLLLYNEKEEEVSAPPYVLDYASTNDYYSKKYKIYLQYQLMRTSFLVVQVWMMMMMC